MEIGNKMVKLPVKVKIALSLYTFVFYGLLLFLGDRYVFSDEPQPLISIVIQSAVFALLMGVVFSFGSEKFASKFNHKLKNKIIPTLEESEEIVAEGPANLYRGIEAVGGRLFLTHQRVIFKSHKLNIQSGQTAILYTEIEKLTPRKTMNLVDNGIRIQLKNGKKHDLVVNNRDTWLHQLTERQTTAVSGKTLKDEQG